MTRVPAIRRAPRLRLTPFAGALLSLTLPGLALATPSGGQVVAGDIQIGQTGAGTVITQGSQNGIINWQDFSIGIDEYVQFIQSSSSAITLNRVVGGTPSAILGDLSANGRVFLINPSGILFGAGSEIDVGSLVATTQDLRDEDFLAGRHVFAGDSSAAITQLGRIQAADGGAVVLVADRVDNQGLIQARLGQVVLGSNAGFTLDFAGDGQLHYQVDAAALSALAGVSNSGLLTADGGRVVMDAQVARGLLRTVVNQAGVIRAEGIDERAGEVWLTAGGGGDLLLASGSRIEAGGAEGGEVRAIAEGLLHYQRGAAIDVARHSSTGAGGFVELSGHRAVRIEDTVDLGGQGRLLIDPSDLTIGEGGSISEAVLEQQLQQGENGSVVQLVASNSITLLDLQDNRLEGFNADTSRGAGLFLGIGSVDEGGAFTAGNSGDIQFTDFNDSIRVEGLLTLQAGTEAGFVDVGNLQGGSVILRGVSGVETGSLNAGAGGRIDVESVGNLLLGSIGQIEDNADVRLHTTNGQILVDGNLLADDLSVFAGNADGSGDDGSVVVAGDVRTAAGARIEADGSIQIGSLSVGDGTRVLDEVRLQALGGGLEILGALAVRGLGTVDALLSAADGLTVSGDTTVEALARDFDVTGAGGDRAIGRGGLASLILDGGTGTVSTGDLQVTGPQATLGLFGARLQVGDGDLADGAVRVTASGQSYQRLRGTSSVVESSYGAAGAVFEASEASLASPAIRILGAVEVSGPSAAVGLLSPGIIEVAGPLSVSGTGYTIDGDWNLLPIAHRPGFETVLPAAFDPLLDQGRGRWGSARLVVAGRSEEGTALEVPVSGQAGGLSLGAVSLTGIGRVDAQIAAGSVSLASLSLDARSRGAGELLGSVAITETTGGGAIYRRDLTIDDGSGAAARLGVAAARIELGTTGALSIGSVEAEGGSASLQVRGGSQINLGAVRLDGGSGSEAARYREQNRYTLTQGSGPARADSQTTVIGGASGLMIEAGGSSVTVGDLEVRGAGQIALAVNAASTVLGAVRLEAESGLLDSNDRELYQTPIRDSLGEVALQLGSDSTPAVVSELRLEADGDVALGVHLVSPGTVSLAIGGEVGSFLPAGFGQLLPPAQRGDAGFATTAFFDGAQLLIAPRLSANDLLWSQGGEVTLARLDLSATRNLVLLGQGSRFTVADSITLASLDRLELGAVTLDTDRVSLVSGGDLSVSTVSIGPDTPSDSVQLQATGALSLLASTVRASDISLLAAGAVDLNGTILTAGDQLSLQAGSALSVRNSSLAAADIGLLAGADITLAGTQLEAADLLSLQAGGAILDGGNSATRLGAARMRIVAAAPAGSGAGLPARSLDGSLSLSTANRIELGAATLSVGSGQLDDEAQFDRALVAGLAAGQRPDALSPNLVLIGDQVTVGSLSLAGDHVMAIANGLRLNGSVAAPAGALLRVAAPDPGADIGFEAVAAGLRGVNLGADGLPGSVTLLLGSSDYLGDIIIGENGVVDVGSQNILLSTGGRIENLDRLVTTGAVSVLAGTVIRPELPPVVEETEAVQNAVVPPSPAAAAQEPVPPPAETTEEAPIEKKTTSKQTSEAASLSCS
ncbi:MAG TPA: filamentous hemagglutinin N-terminal domain-containing protein [Nevskiaceae bacterium]|nr:filamentous hemagglutinin N-terminal domain-containing protein [Nevskiaceae bacterium]